MRRKTRHQYESTEISITPMLDIVFILLIFFIVTTSFVKEIAIDVSRPSTPGETTAKLSEIIAVQISASGEIRVQDRLVDIRAIRANIEAELIAKPDTSVVVIASREANAGLLVTVIDQARVAGADKVLLAEESG